MKTINLFFDFEFTSLSPDAQLISLGIVSEEIKSIPDTPKNIASENDLFSSKSFYAEFSDFDINRCDDWVKDNVVGKLMINSWAKQLNITFEEAKNAAKTSTNWSKEYCIAKSNETEISLVGNTWRIKEELKQWLSQFSNYQIQFVCDCGTFDWYWALQLLAEWGESIVNSPRQKRQDGSEFIDYSIKEQYCKIGLPKLPENISPVPQDLNDLIAIKKGISVKEAFELNREELTVSKCLLIDEGRFDRKEIDEIVDKYQTKGSFNAELATEIRSDTYVKLQEKYKHNALWDAKVIKTIYEKLK